MRIPLLVALALVAVACTSSEPTADTTTTPSVVASTDPPPSTTTDEEPGSEITVIVGRVYTVDPEDRWVEAFSFDADGVIVAVGSADEVIASAGTRANVVDLGDRVVLPGFQDVHVHSPEAGIFGEVCFFPQTATLDEYEAIAVECAFETEGEWVLGAGVSLFDLRDTVELPIDVLDRAIPDRPALIFDDLGHAVWVNSLALEAAGIDPADPDPQGGVHHRDAATGRLTGLLLENAQHAVRDAAALAPDDIYEGLLTTLDEFARHGITSVSDAGGYWTQGHDAAWRRAHDEGTLTVRAANSLYLFPDQDFDEQVASILERRSLDSDLLRFDTIKIYIDGILDLGTALMVDGYADPPDPGYPSGFEYFDRAVLGEYAQVLHEAGFRFNFHVIGDGAARLALDVIEAVEADDVAERRHRLTHVYLVHPADVDRFARLGVVADFQVGPDSIDPLYHEDLSFLIGDRAFDLIPVGTLLDAGAIVTLSSDWDADPLSQLGAIERSLTRADNAVTDLATAIQLVTIDAAYALGHDDVTGSIEVGKYADVVILGDDPFGVPVDQIEEIPVLATLLQGEPILDTIGIGN